MGKIVQSHRSLPVILSEAKNPSLDVEILRSAQGDNERTR